MARRKAFSTLALVSAGLAVSLSACGGNASRGGTIPEADSSMVATTSLKVTTLKDAGTGSLRSAIQAANGSTGESAITFSVNGTIRLASALPSIVRPVLIDGTSAPAYAGKAPVIEIDANGLNGLVFATGAAHSQLLAIAVDNAGGPGVMLEAGSVTLNLNYIGLTPRGTALGNRGDGVYVAAQSSGDDIGVNPKRTTGYVANVISGNSGNGVSLHGSSGNTIASNRIGTDPLGRTALPNAGNGIWIAGGSQNNEIGGTAFVDTATGQANNPTGNKGTVTPVFVVPPLGNLVSGNRKNGIRIDTGSQSNVLNGNFIGTNAGGDAAIPNVKDGVAIDGANANSLIGCKFRNNPFVYYNVSSGNGGNGVHVTDSDDVVIQGNFFGVGANNTNIVPNKGDGILVDGSSAGTVVGGVIPLGNVSAGNSLNGIEVADTASGFTTFNTFGGLLAFKGAAPNGGDGLLITSTGGNQTVRTNVFSGNTGNGIEIAGDASGVTVDPDIAGLTTAGNALLPNGANGLLVDGTAHGNTIGGYTQSVIPQDTFSGNRGYGILIAEQAYDIQIFNSYIGTNVRGSMAMPNVLGGIGVARSAKNVTIGGRTTDPTQPRQNVISGNYGNGVTLGPGSSYVKVIANYIGITSNAKNRLVNSGKPVVVDAGSTNATVAGNVVVPQ